MYFSMNKYGDGAWWLLLHSHFINISPLFNYGISVIDDDCI